MECPKCGYTIDDNALVCPNCKKVLKLICPICKTVNKTNTCNNCGYLIVNKCHQCGKINQTIAGKCSKCGFDTNVSAILQGSNIEEFACLSIDFPNLKDMATILGSVQLYKKFKLKLNELINNYVKSIGLRRQIIGDTYIIRFNKDYTYATSAANAVKSSIELLNLITKMNYRLTKAKDAQLKCNIAILKRNAYATNEDYKSGINIQMLYQNVQTNLISSLQLIVDGSIFEVVGKEYPMTSIGMTRAKSNAIFLYEMDLTNYIKYEEEDDEDDEDETEQAIKIPDIIEAQQEVLENEESLYDMNSIDFNEIHCDFTSAITQGLGSEVVQRLMEKPKNIIVLKGKKETFPRAQEIVDKVKSNNVFNHVFKITCYEDLKYKPYGFFYELITLMFSYNVTGKYKEQNDFASTKVFDKSDFIPNMINLEAREFPHPEDVRAGLFEAFENMIARMQNTLILIENMELMNETSFELFQDLLLKFDRFNVSYVIMSNKDYSLHKSAHFLLSKQEYTEITIKPTPIKAIIDANAALCKNVMDTFYMQKITRNTKGSQLYFMLALIHLMDIGVFEVKEGSLVLKNPLTVVFPTTLDELIQKRIQYIRTIDENLYQIFALMLLIGPQIDIRTISDFRIENITDYLTYLDSKGFITNNNGIIQIESYNLYYENTINVMDFEEKRKLANYLIVNCFRQNSAHPVLAKLFNLVESSKNEFVQWENLSNINQSLGDFSAYLNCSLKFLKLLDNNVNETSEKSIEEYKMEVYENIANLLYKYTPEKIANITQIILDNLERGMQDKKVINLCNKIMQGCLISGNYTHALLMSHKILSRIENPEINPQNPNFSITAFLISLVKIEILFNVGDLEDCITLGNELFTILANNGKEAVKPKTIADKQFDDLLVDAAGYIIFASVLQLKQNTYQFCELAEKVLVNLPQSYKYFAEIDNLLHGKPVNFNSNEKPNDNEKFAGFLFNIVNTFHTATSPNDFATKIYSAKLSAKKNNLNQLELFCDLMIGKSYLNMNNYKKATAIYNSVLETSTNNGLKNITYIAWYLIAEASLKNNEINTAYGLIFNAMVELEKNSNTNMYLLMIIKILQATVLKIKKEDTQSNFCYNQAKQISERYKIKLNLK